MFNIVTPCDKDLISKHILNAKRIFQLLEYYLDQRFPQILTSIIIYNAHLDYEGIQSATIRLKNHKSIFEWSIILEEEINEDLKLHRTRIIDSLSKVYYISSLDLISKTMIDVIMNWRRIHDLSASANHSINDEIPKHYKIIIYKIFQSILRYIAKTRKECKLIKWDLKSAFRFIPINPHDHWLFMYEWNERIYVELFLSFGLRIASLIFNLFNEVIHWIMQFKEYKLYHYIDDFLLVLSPRIYYDSYSNQWLRRNLRYNEISLLNKRKIKKGY